MLYNTHIMENTLIPTFIQHNIDREMVAWLEMKFAYLTPDGWVIPEWIEILKKTAKH